MTSRAKKRILAAVAVLAIAGGVGGAYVARTALRDRALTRARETGMAAYDRGDYAEAMPQLSRYVGRNQQDTTALLALADCRRRIPEENGRHLVVALGMARAAVQATPENARGHELVLELCDQLGFNTEAQDTAKKLLAIDPNHPAALRARVRALAVVGNRDQALESAREWAARHPDSTDAYDAIVVLLNAMNRPEEAREAASKAAEAHPEDVGFALLECRTALILRDTTGATSAAKRAAKLQVRTREELQQLAAFLQILRLPQETEELLANARQDKALASEAALIAAERAWKTGDREKAKELAAAIASPDAATPERELAIRCIIETDAPGAEKTQHALAELGRRSNPAAAYWAGVLRGREALLREKLPEAETELAAAAGLDSAPGYAQFFLGETHIKALDFRRAAEQFVAATRTDPAWRTARTASIALLERTGQLNEARRQAIEGYAATLWLFDAVEYARISVTMLESGQAPPGTITDVLTDLEKIHADRPDNPYVLSLWARALLAAGRTEEAAGLTEKLLSLPEPPPLQSVSRLAIAFQRAGHPIAQRLDALIDRSASGTDALAARARVLEASGRTAEAIALLRDALQKAEESERVRLSLLLAALLDATGQPEAKDMLASLAEANPSRVELQLGVLNSHSAWSDEAVISSTLERLANIVGKESDVWKLHDARRLLTFTGTNAVAARVILSLSPIAREDPGNVATAMVLAEAHMMVHDRDRAIESLSRAVNASPASWAAYPRLIELLQLAGRAGEASQRLNDFRGAAELSVPLQRQRARLLARQGMRAEYAKDIADLAARGGPGDRLLYATERANAGDIAAAKAQFDALLAEESPSTAAVIGAARFESARQDVDAGLAVLDRAPASADASDVERARADLLAEHGRRDEAERLYRDRTKGGAPEAWADLAQFLIDGGRAGEAAASIQSGLAAAPKDTRLLWLSAMVKLRSGAENTAAIEELGAALNDPNIAPDFREIALALRAYGEDSDVEKLLRALEQITRTYPASYLAWRELANSYAMTGQIDQAAKAATSAAQALPGDPRAAQLATEALMHAGRIPEAIAMAARWREASPRDTLRPDVARTQLAYMQRKYAEAVSLLLPYRARLVESAETEGDALELLASCLAAAGREPEARDLLLARAEQNPVWHVRYLRVTRSLLPKVDGARAWAGAVPISESSEAAVSITAAQAWGAIHAASGKPEDLDQSMRFARLAAEDKSLRSPAMAILANGHHLKNELDQAIAAYREADRAAPDDPSVLNNLAYLIALTNPSDEALTFSRRAVELAEARRLADSMRANFLDTLGFCAGKLGKFQEAELAFQRGLSLAPMSLDLLVGLAEAKLGLGDAKGATEVLGRIDQAAAGASGQMNPDLSARIGRVRERLRG